MNWAEFSCAQSESKPLLNRINGARMGQDSAKPDWTGSSPCLGWARGELQIRPDRVCPSLGLNQGTSLSGIRIAISSVDQAGSLLCTSAPASAGPSFPNSVWAGPAPTSDGSVLIRMDRTSQEQTELARPRVGQISPHPAVHQASPGWAGSLHPAGP